MEGRNINNLQPNLILIQNFMAKQSMIASDNSSLSNLAKVPMEDPWKESYCTTGLLNFLRAFMIQQNWRPASENICFVTQTKNTQTGKMPKKMLMLHRSCSHFFSAFPHLIQTDLLSVSEVSSCRHADGVTACVFFITIWLSKIYTMWAHS